MIKADENKATADFSSVINVSLLPSRLVAGGTRLPGIMCEPGSVHRVHTETRNLKTMKKDTTPVCSYRPGQIVLTIQ